MSGSIDDQSAAVLRENLAPNQLDGASAAVTGPLVNVVGGLHRVPVDRRTTKEHADAVVARCREVRLTNGAKKLLVDRRIPDGPRLGRVLPDVTERVSRDVFTADEAIHQGLVPGVSPLD